MRTLFHKCLVIAIIAGITLAGVALAAAPARAQEETPQAPTDVPDVLVPSGVTRFTMTSPKVFWYTGVPICPPPQESGAAEPDQTYFETIKRVATYGSPERTLYEEAVNCSGDQVLSNIVSDGDFLYWLGPVGLMKLSTDANPGDEPQLMNALVQPPGEVADGGDVIYVIYDNYGGSQTKIAYVRKDNNARVPLTTPGNYAGNLQTDGEFVYYLVGATLYRLEPGVDTGQFIAGSVTGYYPEGQRLLFCTIDPFQCYYSNRVYIGQGQYIRVYSNIDDTLDPDPIYDSVDSTASVRSLVTDFDQLFFFEQRTIPCSPDPCFPTYTTVLQRTGRGGGAVDSLYTYGPSIFGGPDGLTTDGSFLFFHEDDRVLRLPNDASALPVVNMYFTGMEVTQGIQNLANSVLLVKGKRTFVRLYVKSAGPSVSDVSARLYSPQFDTYLQPVNPVGTKITVRTNPSRADINQSFLFELPWTWTRDDTLTLHADVNPFKVPLEPSYADNGADLNLNFQESPTLSVEFFRLNYTLNNTTYTPRFVEDVLKTYSWIQRAYPIGGAVGENFKPRLWDVDGGAFLGSLVDQSSIICDILYGGEDDDPALCASYITNGWLFSYRINTMFGLLNVGLKSNAFYYGMISDGSNNFPRGQAVYSKTSVGPSGTPGQFFNLGSGWDTDGSYADWYAAHEIGHSLGRAHPNSGSDNPATEDVFENCRHSRSDPGYPYGNTSTASAPIGPADGSMEGFDAGDPYFNIPMAVLPSNIWNDVMSYCNNQWISDYTYTGMYNNMIANPSLQSASLPQAGDFLAVAGVINPATNVAGIAHISRLDSVINTPPLIPGDYSLRLLDAGDAVLADYAFTPEEDSDTGTLGFGQVVDFVEGTLTVQVVRLADEVVLASQSVSANPPEVYGVALQGAPDPVDGVVTLEWTATDPDDDDLNIEIAYSRDNGVTFQPVMLVSSGDSTQIDTALLGGSGTAILRVIVSDGVNTAYADSAQFTMANKPPQPFILSPADGLHIHYGQLVNFSGMAQDVQDGLVTPSSLYWTDGDGDPLGAGAQFSMDNLPVGLNTIILQATNSMGETATTSITIIVDDDLSLPGPTLTAGPATVSWHVPAGETALQTAEVSINNAGSGELDWTASDNVAWLTISPITGTVGSDDPSTLTLTADPSGLAEGATFNGAVTITRPASGGDAEQVVVIPVSLSVGDIWTVTPGESAPGSGKLYLPMIRR